MGLEDSLIGPEAESQPLKELRALVKQRVVELARDAQTKAQTTSLQLRTGGVIQRKTESVLTFPPNRLPGQTESIWSSSTDTFSFIPREDLSIPREDSASLVVDADADAEPTRVLPPSGLITEKIETSISLNPQAPHTVLRKLSEHQGFFKPHAGNPIAFAEMSSVALYNSGGVPHLVMYQEIGISQIDFGREAQRTNTFSVQVEYSLFGGLQRILLHLYSENGQRIPLEWDITFTTTSPIFERADLGVPNPEIPPQFLIPAELLLNRSDNSLPFRIECRPPETNAVFIFETKIPLQIPLKSYVQNAQCTHSDSHLSARLDLPAEQKPRE